MMSKKTYRMTTKITITQVIPQEHLVHKLCVGQP